MAKHTKTMWTHVRRSPYQAVAAILIMMITFLMLTFFAFIITGSQKVINYLESKPQVTAFFADTAKQEDIDKLKNDIMASGKVAKIKYVSKEDALNIYKEQNKDNPLLLELVTADVLPASLEISTYNLDDLATVANSLKTAPIVQEVVFQKDVVKTLSSWTNGVRQVGLFLILLLGVESILVMTIIVGIKVALKKDEIEIMKLIGATDWYISLPFIYEGMFYAGVGAFIGWVLATGGLLAVTPALVVFLRGIPVFPVSPLFLIEVLGVELVIAIILGFTASSLAVKRYLK